MLDARCWMLDVDDVVDVRESTSQKTIRSAEVKEQFLFTGSDHSDHKILDILQLRVTKSPS